MASQIINVIVNSKGAVTVARELNAIGNSARATTTYLNGLRAVLAAALTFSGAGQIIETIDNFTALQNRLKLVANESDSVGESWQRLMGIANSSYSTIDNTVNLYFRVAQAYKAWGESAESAYEFTDLFQKAAMLSGSTMQTTSQAVYQFSQALNKGKLDGDEFRSVLEGLPYVANLIQKSLGVTRAELYQMSKGGMISVDRIKKAFEDAAAVIRGDWANITPTIGMALVVLKNNWTDFVGSIQTSTGIFSGFAYLILAVANNFELLAIALAPVIVSLGFLAGRLGIGLVVLGFKDLILALRTATVTQWLFNASVYANPYVLAAAAIAAVVVAIIYFRNELGLTNEVLLSMWETAKSVFLSIISFLATISTPLKAVLRYFYTWEEIWKGIKTVASAVGTTIVATFNYIVAAIKTSIESTKTWVTAIKTDLQPIFQSLNVLAKAFMGLMSDIGNYIAEKLVPIVGHLKEVFTQFWEYIRPVLTDIIEGWSKIYSWLQYIDNIVRTKVTQAFSNLFWNMIADIKAVIDWVVNLINKLRQMISLQSRTGAGGGGGGGGAHYGAQFKAGEGFATGGAFKVGGTGAGRDTTPVAFRAERGERVTVETKKQQRMAANGNGGSTEVKVPLSITNVFDPAMVPAANESASGQRSIVNVIRANRDEINQALGIS